MTVMISLRDVSKQFPSSAGAAPSYRTALGLAAAAGAPANFSIFFHEAAGGNVAATRQVSVAGGATQVYGDVLAVQTSTGSKLLLEVGENRLGHGV